MMISEKTLSKNVKQLLLRLENDAVTYVRVTTC